MTVYFFWSFLRRYFTNMDTFHDALNKRLVHYVEWNNGLNHLTIVLSPQYTGKTAFCYWIRALELTFHFDPLLWRSVWTWPNTVTLLALAEGWVTGTPAAPGHARPHRDYFAVNINILRPEQNGGNFADDICKCIYLYGNNHLLIKNFSAFVPNQQ